MTRLCLLLALAGLANAFVPTPTALPRGGSLALGGQRLAAGSAALKRGAASVLGLGRGAAGRLPLSMAATDSSPNPEAAQLVAQTQLWASAVSVGESKLEAGVQESIDLVKEQLGGAKPDVAFIFVSSRYLEGRGGSQPATKGQLSAIVPTVQRGLGVKHVIAVTASGVLGVSEEDGTPEEFENFKSVALTAARLPGVDIKPFRLNKDQIPKDLGASQQAWRQAIKGPDEGQQPCFVVLSGQQFAGTGRLGTLIEGLDFSYSDSVKVGGISSGPIPGGVACSEGGGEMRDDEVVGFSMTGDLEVEPVVAQGCRAVGPLFEVVKSEGNGVMLVTEEGKGDKKVAPMAALRSVLQSLEPKDVQLAQTALLIGVARDSFSDELGAGDYLIRQVVGVSVKDGSLIFGDAVRPGKRFRFHVRDREAAVSEAEALFSGYKRKRLMEMMSGKKSADASGCLMFACTGRGRGLYNEANFDSRLAYLSTGVPVTGLFCNGEIGPVGGSTHLHGFTSVFAIFRQKSRQPVKAEGEPA